MDKREIWLRTNNGIPYEVQLEPPSYTNSYYFGSDLTKDFLQVIPKAAAEEREKQLLADLMEAREALERTYVKLQPLAIDCDDSCVRTHCTNARKEIRETLSKLDEKYPEKEK